MKIKKMISQFRRDFSAILECQFCETTKVLNTGYDDRNYHDNVIPAMKCGHCNKSTNSEGAAIENTPTKYSTNQII